MIVKDMDICLNVSAEPAAAASKNKTQREDALLGSIRRLKNQSLTKQKVSGNKQSGQNISQLTGQNVTAQKRIKQKSLSQIVAQKLKESNAAGQSRAVQIRPKPKARIVNPKVTNNKQNVIKPTPKTSTDSAQLNKHSASVDNKSPQEPIISFTKVTKNHVGKTLLARKRNASETGAKKSLSDIFSKGTDSKKSEFNLLSSVKKADTDESVVPNKKLKLDKPKEPVHTTKKSNFENRKGKKFKDDVRKKPYANAETNKDSQFQHKSTGKISSLFGHNPEVPNIGQRFVKPINEAVFTGLNFTDLNVHPFTISNLEQNMSITKMTTVQQKAIPQIFSGKDILVRSQTGSGKTLAYALPIVEYLHQIRPKLNRNSGLKALVVVPTRELALQTYECFLKLIKPFTWIVPGYLTGGEKRKAEKARLRRGCNILVGTPGRLLDHIKHTEALKLHEVKFFILDEADRMFDMGYEKDISGIVSALKVATPGSKTEYDAMQMLRQNVKKVFTDEDVDQLENDMTDSTDQKTDVGTSKDDNDSECEDEPETDRSQNADIKQSYHSSSESDSEEGEPFVKSKKIEKRVGIKPVKNQTPAEGKEVESACSKDDIDRSRRQTILLSATLTQAVEKLAGLTMESPVFVDAAKENLEKTGGDMSDLNEDLVVPQSVVQSYIVTPPKLRMVTLSAYIAGKCQSSGQHKILVFMATQDMVDYHMEILPSVLTKPIDENDEDSDPLVDVEFFKLHGSMSQKERTDVFKTFRQARSGVLLCTDVAARGLDMPKVDCVVQYTGPLSARDYVHRIGRTARAGSSGAATIFLTPPEIEFVRMLESKRIRIKQEDMNDILDKLLVPLSRHNSVQAAAIALQNEFETLVIERQKLRERACKAYVSWVRFYASYPRDMREMFNRKDLHLGHYAKSFALRDPPQRIGGIGKTLRENDNTKRQHNNRLANERPDGVPQKKPRTQPGGGPKTGLLKRVRMLNTSEYGSGLEPLRKPAKP